MNNQEKIKLLNEYIEESDNIIFFGGAGVSTESGIKDFRSKDGLYNEKYKYPPEEILSHTFFINNPDEFYKFYIEKLNCLEKTPNICHEYLTKLEKSNKLKAIITQNIDGLHQKAGSSNILELHGSIYRNYCIKCNKSYPPEEIFIKKNYICTCGGIIKPNVVLYEEPLDNNIINNAIKHISNADLLLVVGTSLTVYPASSFIQFFKGKHLIIINKDTTPLDNLANLIINDDIKDVFNYLNKNLHK